MKPNHDGDSSHRENTPPKTGKKTPDTTDPMELTLRDLERKRAEIDAAIENILAARPDLKPGRKRKS
jgi:hypothetical protein